MRDDRKRLRDVLEAIERIERYSLSPAFRAANPDDVWTQAAGLRNVIVHEYFGIDRDIVWGVVEKDLPFLKQRILRCLAEAP